MDVNLDEKPKIIIDTENQMVDYILTRKMLKI